MREFLGELQYKNFFKNPLPLLLKIARWLEADMEFHRLLINSRRAEQFLVKLKNIFVSFFANDNDISNHIRKSPAFFIHMHVFVGRIINLYQLWFKDEIGGTLDE
ncbi:MAG: TetR/AcrR family transcriptional regulator C-terminal domain-containing protein, partial [Tannerella sp.]|nr:TetR/AcrR family transcriptional regulator C-terminal domain-containing protein [Tannerella sp.]